MKKTTEQALQAILSCDSSIPTGVRARVLQVLAGEDVSRAQPLPLLLSQAAAGRLLGCSAVTIWRMVRAGRLHPVVALGLPKIRRAEIEAIAAGGVRVKI